MLTAYCAQLSRSQLLDAFTQKSTPSFTRLDLPCKQTLWSFGSGDCVFGYWGQARYPNNPPDFIVISQIDARDLFAWIATYAPVASPISQWAQVFDQQMFSGLTSEIVIPNWSKAGALWTGAVLGEAISRAGAKFNSNAFSVGAATACFTYPVARSIGLWGNRISINQLSEKIEKTTNLIHALPRRLTSIELRPVWDILVALTSSVSSDKSKSKFVDNEGGGILLRACTELLEFGSISASALNALSKGIPIGDGIHNLPNLTAEQRVDLFDQAVDALLRSHGTAWELSRSCSEFIIAYLASRIQGGGNKNFELIRNLVDKYPLVGVWYGIHLALGQFSYWGNEFGGLGRLIQKEINFPLHIVEQPKSDLVMEELEAIVPLAGSSLLPSFRGAAAKLISIQLFPGVSISYAMQGLRGEIDVGEAQTNLDLLDKSRIIDELDESLNRLWNLRQSLSASAGQKDRRPPDQTSTTNPSNGRRELGGGTRSRGRNRGPGGKLL